MRRIVETIPQTNINPAYRRPTVPSEKSRKCQGCFKQKTSAIPRKNIYSGEKSVLCTLCYADRLTQGRLARQRNNQGDQK